MPNLNVIISDDLKNILIFMNQDIERAKIELNDIINKNMNKKLRRKKCIKRMEYPG